MQSANARLKRHLATSEDFENFIAEEEAEMDLVVSIIMSLVAVGFVVLLPLYNFNAPQRNPQPQQQQQVNRPRRNSNRPRRSNSRPESVQESSKNSSSNVSQISTKQAKESMDQVEEKEEEEKVEEK